MSTMVLLYLSLSVIRRKPLNNGHTIIRLSFYVQSNCLNHVYSLSHVPYTTTLEAGVNNYLLYLSSR